MNENLNGKNFNGNQRGQTSTPPQIPSFEFSNQQGQTSTNPQVPSFEFSNQQGQTSTNPQVPSFDMWGNNNSAGEEIFSGKNFGASNGLSDIVNVNAELPASMGSQNIFGNFAQGGMNSQMFGGQGGQFNQTSQTSQTRSR